MKRDARIYVAGHRGMVGSAIVRKLAASGHTRLLTPARAELDLRNQASVFQWFERERPEVVVVAAAKVGGIHANNTYPAEFIMDNLAIALNCVEAAHRTKAARLLFLGSSCIYPKHAPQPMPEDCLLSGPLEPTNEAYAIAKIAGLKLCQHYRKQYGVLFHSLMPTNLYGPGDNYHPRNSHVLPALIRRFHEAKLAGAPEVVIWGTGAPKREFLHVDDLAAATEFLLRLEDPPDWINVGSGVDLSIKELAELVMRVVGYDGRLTFDTTKPDGTPRKLMDVSKLAAIGWRAAISIEDGVRRTYAAFIEESASGRLREA
jgi:GDP-L-fucose synthase